MDIKILDKKYEDLINSPNYYTYLELSKFVLKDNYFEKNKNYKDLYSQKKIINKFFQKLSIKKIISDNLIIDNNYFKDSQKDKLYYIYTSSLIFNLLNNYKENIPFFDIFDTLDNYNKFRKKSPNEYYSSLLFDNNISQRKLVICLENIENFINFEKELTNNILNNNLLFEIKLNNLVIMLNNKYDQLRENKIKINTSISKELSDFDNKYWTEDFKYEIKLNKTYIKDIKLMIDKIYDKIIESDILIENNNNYKNILYSYDKELNNINNTVDKNIEFITKFNDYLSKINHKCIKEDKILLEKLDKKILKQEKNIENLNNILNKLNILN